MTTIILLLISVVWPLGQLAIMPPILGQSWTALDLLTGLLWISLLPKRRSIIADPLFWPFTLFTLSLSLSLLSNLTFSFHLLRWISTISVYFALRCNKINKKIFTFPIILFVALGLAQYFFIPDTRFLQYYNFDDHYYRLIGSLFDPNFTGLILAQLTLLTTFPSQLLLLISLALTFSRASYLAFLPGYLYLHRRHPQLYLLLLALFVFIILAPKPFGEGVNLFRTFSITSRLFTQQQAIKLFFAKPLFGWGFDTLPISVDNSYLYIAATSGLLGLVTFINLLKHIWKQGIVSPVFTSIFLILLTHSFFNNSFFYLWATILLWASLAVLPKVTKSPAAPSH